MTISTCSEVSKCSPKTLTFSPGTYTITGTAAVPIHSDVVVTKAAAGTAASSRSTGVASSSTGATTNFSGEGARNLVSTLIGAMGLILLMW